MSVTILSSAMAKMADRGRISATDVLSLRQTVFADGIASAAEADVLIRLHNVCAPDIEAWTGFFIEALTDYVVYQTTPRGYVTSQNADWLIERISRDGKVENAADLELLVSVLDKARWSPPRLAAFAIDQVRRAVIEGKGPARAGMDLEAGVMTEVDVNLIRRVIYAFSGEQAIGISKCEAEMLFDLNDQTAGKENHRDWPELFIKAIANHIMVTSGYKPLPRDEVLRREAWLDSSNGLSGFMDKMMSGGVSSIFDAYQLPSREERAFEKLEHDRMEMLLGERVTEDEADWLIERIGRDGDITENEKALLAFLKVESPDVHPSLIPMLEMAS